MAGWTGECLCGAVRYSVVGEPPRATYLCHCSRCRKETGTVHATNVFFDNAVVQWERGADNRTFFSLPGTRKARTFCTTCGSPLPTQKGPGRVLIPAGTLDGDALVAPTAHIFCGSAAVWEGALSQADRFQELPE